MSNVYHLHRLAGGIDKLRREAAVGPCRLCGEPSVGFIEGWEPGAAGGVCEEHAAIAPRLGYVVHTLDELDKEGQR